LVVHSVTKFLGGHHDLSAGVVVGNRRWMERIQQFGYLLGATLGANDAAMAVRGIRTLAPRMAWISESAMEVAAWLDTRPEVARVRYPGLACGQPGNLAKRMLPDGFGGVVVAEFASDERASRVADFVRELKMVPYAPSLGGEITTVCYPPRLRHHLDANSHEPELRLRFSIGLEHPADLIDDLDQAFAATAG
jgi:cystathionine gamma-synthase